MEKSKQLLIKIGICLIITLGCIIFIKHRNKPSDPNDVNIQIEKTSENSTYESKLQAYKDKKRMEQEQAYNKGYSGGMDVVQPVDPLQEDQAASISIQSQERPEAGASQASARPSLPMKTTHRQTEKKSEAIHDLENVIKKEVSAGGTKEPMYIPPASPSSPTNEPDEKERRRKAMQTWNKQDNATTTGKTYQAVIHKEQVVSNGKMAAFRTKEDIDTGNLTIPANTLLYGTVSVTQNRLIVNISSVTINKNVYPIKLSVYGTDGAPGIPVQIDNVQKAADSKIGDEIVSATKKRTGVIGDVVGGIANAMKREKDISCTLIDNQTIYLKLN